MYIRTVCVIYVQLIILMKMYNYCACKTTYYVKLASTYYTPVTLLRKTKSLSSSRLKKTNYHSQRESLLTCLVVIASVYLSALESSPISTENADDHETNKEASELTEEDLPAKAPKRHDQGEVMQEF